MQGAEQLGDKVQGSRKWIGTTEAATILRYFGVRACIVDFGAKSAGSNGCNASNSGPSAAPGKFAPEACAGADTASEASVGMQKGSSGATVHIGVECDVCGVMPIVGVRHKSEGLDNFDVCSACLGSTLTAAAAPFVQVGTSGAGTSINDGRASALQPPSVSHGDGQDARGADDAAGLTWDADEEAARSSAAGEPSASGSNGGATPPSSQRLLMLWVWRYFSGEDVDVAMPPGSGGGGGGGRHGARPGTSLSMLRRSQVTVSHQPPLYFQHEGHSRTIIGIERRPKPAAQARGLIHEYDYTLLILDPGTHTQQLAAAIRAKQGWQKYLKRGLHTLKKPQYQVMYIKDGVMAASEAATWKVIAASERY